MAVDHAAFDRELLDQLRQGRVADAATSAVKTYGAEIYALFASIHRSEQDAAEVFSVFCERLWHRLPRFEGRSLFRTWAYTVAWHASSGFRRRQLANREVPVLDEEFEEMVQKVRTSTTTRLRREKRSRLRELRETLPPEDQALLVLRVERELDWKDLARVMNPESDLDEKDLVREAARLRKRFQIVKER